MTPTKYSFYQQIAKYRKASLLTSQYRAIVHLENKNDQTFWGKLLEIACPGSLFQFIPYTRSLSGNRGEGCAQCLVFKDFLDKNFVIAIDSDLHYLLKDLHDMDIEHFILQTYTYSFENHLCFAERLNDLPEKVCGLPNHFFDFNKFLLTYSDEVYPLFLLFLYDRQQDKRYISDNDFYKLLNFTGVKDKLKDNGADILSELHTRMKAEIIRLKKFYPDYDEVLEHMKYSTLGLSESNTYLYIRGHNLFNLITEIGEAICYKLKMNEKNRLELEDKKDEIKKLYTEKETFTNKIFKDVLFVGYPEIDKCIRDIRFIWKA